MFREREILEALQSILRQQQAECRLKLEIMERIAEELKGIREDIRVELEEIKGVIKDIRSDTSSISRVAGKFDPGNDPFDDY